MASPLSRFLVTLQGHDGSTVQTLNFATDGFTSVAGVAAATEYQGRLIDPGNFEQHMFAAGTTRGRAQIGIGDIVLASGDIGGGDNLDYLLSWGFDGRQVIIRLLENDSNNINDALVLLIATIEQLISDNAYTRLSFKIHNKLTDLEKPILTETFLGTTTAGGLGTIEGNSDMLGQKKQQCFGKVYNVTPQIANAFDLVYLFNNGPVETIDAYDGGIALTHGGDEQFLTNLFNWVQVPGQYRTCVAEGVIRLGTKPVGDLTADVVEGGTAPIEVVGTNVGSPFSSFGSADWTIYGSTVTGTGPWTITETAVNSTHGALIGYFNNPSMSRYRFVGEFSRGTGNPRNLSLYATTPFLTSIVNVIVDLETHTIIATPVTGTEMVLLSASASQTSTLRTRVIFEFQSGDHAPADVSNLVTILIQSRSISPALEAYLGDGISKIQVHSLQLLPTSAPALFCSAAQIVQRMIIQRTNFDLAPVDNVNLLPTDFTTWTSHLATLVGGSPSVGLYQLIESSTPASPAEDHYAFYTITKAAWPISYRFTAEFKAVGSRKVFFLVNDGVSFAGFAFDPATAIVSAVTESGSITAFSAVATILADGFCRFDVGVQSSRLTNLTVQLRRYVDVATGGDGASGFMVRNINMFFITPIDFNSVDKLDRQTDSESCGILVTGEDSGLDAAQQVLDSVTGYLLTDRNGLFTVGRMNEPASIPQNPVEALTEANPWTTFGCTLSQVVSSPDVPSPDVQSGIWRMIETPQSPDVSSAHYFKHDFVKSQFHLLVQFSAEFKANGRNVAIYLADSAYRSWVELWIDLTAGTKIYSTAYVNGIPTPFDAYSIEDWSITAVGDGYWRVVLSATCSTETTLQIAVEAFPTYSTVTQMKTNFGVPAYTYAGDGSSGFFIRNWSLHSLLPSVMTIDESMIIGDVLQRQATGDQGNGVPVWKTTTRYSKNYTLMTGTQVLGAATDARRLFIGNEWRSTPPLENSPVHDVHLLAGESVIDSLLTDSARALYENCRVHNMHSEQRNAYVVEVDLVLTFNAIIGSTVTLQTTQTQRFGLGSGLSFRVIGRTENFQKKTATLVLWR